MTSATIVLLPTAPMGVIVEAPVVEAYGAEPWKRRNVTGFAVSTALGAGLLVASYLGVSAEVRLKDQVPFLDLGVGGLLAGAVGGVWWLAAVVKAVRLRKAAAVALVRSRFDSVEAAGPAGRGGGLRRRGPHDPVPPAELLAGVRQRRQRRDAGRALGGRAPSVRGVWGMNDLLPFIIAGITSGSIYGLAAMGLVLSYKTSGIFNFAHGAIAAAAAYLFYTLQRRARHGLAGRRRLVCVAIGGPLLGLAPRVPRPAAGRRPAGPEGRRHRRSAAGHPGAHQRHLRAATCAARRSSCRPSRFSIGGTQVEYSQLIVVLLSTGAAVGLFLFFRSTRLGVAMRGVVDDPTLLALDATNPVRVRRAAWLISASSPPPAASSSPRPSASSRCC